MKHVYIMYICIHEYIYIYMYIIMYIYIYIYNYVYIYIHIYIHTEIVILDVLIIFIKQSCIYLIYEHI